MKPINENDPAFAALYKETRERAMELGERQGLPEEVLHQVLDSVTDPGRFADLVAGYVELPVAEKQALLETLGVEERLRRVLIHVQQQIGMLAAQDEIKSQVQEELGERQREMFLREQMKAIQKELGEDDQSREIDELRDKLSKLELPREARAEVERELGRLERAGRESMEAQVIRTYLEWVAELPWNTRSDDNLDLNHAIEVLDEDHYGLQDVKDRVLEFLAVRQLRARQLAEEVEKSGECPAAKLKADKDTATPSPRARPGRRGPGDHRLAARPRRGRWPGGRSCCSSARRAWARRRSPSRSPASLGRKYVRAALGGVRDEADIRGHRRTYVGAMPGRIIQGMKQAGTKNPVFLLDEVDKLGVSFQGDPASALLEVLDPAQNDTFTDHYLNVPFDLSEVLFIATANFLQNIPGAAARPHGGGRVRRLHRAREGGDRQEVPDPPPARGVGAGRPGRSRSPTTRSWRSSASTPARAASASSSGRSAPWRGSWRGRIAAGEAVDLTLTPETSASCSAGPGSIPSTPARPTRSAWPPACTTPRPAATSCSSRRRSAGSTALAAATDATIRGRRLGQRLARSSPASSAT